MLHFHRYDRYLVQFLINMAEYVKYQAPMLRTGITDIMPSRKFS